MHSIYNDESLSWLVKSDSLAFMETIGVFQLYVWICDVYLDVTFCIIEVLTAQHDDVHKLPGPLPFLKEGEGPGGEATDDGERWQSPPHTLPFSPSTTPSGVTDTATRLTIPQSVMHSSLGQTLSLVEESPFLSSSATSDIHYPSYLLVCVTTSSHCTQSMTYTVYVPHDVDIVLTFLFSCSRVCFNHTHISSYDALTIISVCLSDAHVIIHYEKDRGLTNETKSKSRDSHSLITLGLEDLHKHNIHAPHSYI